MTFLNFGRNTLNDYVRRYLIDDSNLFVHHKLFLPKLCQNSLDLASSKLVNSEGLDQAENESVCLAALYFDQLNEIALFSALLR